MCFVLILLVNSSPELKNEKNGEVWWNLRWSRIILVNSSPELKNEKNGEVWWNLRWSRIILVNSSPELKNEILKRKWNLKIETKFYLSLFIFLQVMEESSARFMVRSD